ncbi:MAG TPA: helix-turn-helix domain-containing protein [Candidatus Acidoferrum sp.]|nr:helix-turn-helix domain-containing protein [Candidatus Acidoferrum sp.]
MERESYTVREASRALGLSVPTVIRMCEEGTLQHFVSPGGHRRIPSEAITAVRTNGRGRSSTTPMPSSVLQNRRERLEELGLDAQEIRARRELEKLHAEQDDEAERHAAHTRERETERQCQLERARAERLRQERLKEEADTEERRARLRQQVQLALSVTLPADLPFEKQRALADALEAELLRANAEDAETAIPIIKAVTDRFITSLLAEDRARQQRTRVLESVLLEVRWTSGSTEVDEAKATDAVRGVLSSLAPDATEIEMRRAAKAAIATIREKIEQRVRRNEIIESGVQEIVPYLERLERAGGISRKTLVDYRFVTALKDSVRTRLQEELTTEGPANVRKLVHELVDGELE